MKKKKLVRPRAGHPRPVVKVETIDVFLRGYNESSGVVLSGAWGRDILVLARGAFSDSGTSAHDLDEELQEIDDAIRGAGYEPQKASTIVALKNIIERMKIAERELYGPEVSRRLRPRKKRR